MKWGVVTTSNYNRPVLTGSSSNTVAQAELRRIHSGQALSGPFGARGSSVLPSNYSVDMVDRPRYLRFALCRELVAYVMTRVVSR